MKKSILTFFLILLATTTSFSQTISNEIKRDSTVLITSDQLKRTNLIFVEHEALLKTNSLLHQQLANYKLNNNLLLRSDSIHKVEIDKYKLLTESFSSEITSLNKEIKRKDRTILTLKIGGVTIGSGLLLWLLLK